MAWAAQDLVILILSNAQLPLAVAPFRNESLADSPAGRGWGSDPENSIPMDEEDNPGEFMA